MELECFQFRYGADNYGVLLHDPREILTTAIDVGDAYSYSSALKANGWTLDQIWITHHHADHTDGLSELKKETGALVIGPKNVTGVEKGVSEGDVIKFGQCEVQIIETPGHTLDMINYYIPSEKLIFTGDTLFVMGCGRLFEGSSEQMFRSICKIMAFPADTVLYCSHEYTLANSKFALSVDPNNNDLIKRAKKLQDIISLGNHTVPTTIGLEAKTNPFCRSDDLEIRRGLDMINESNEDVFTKLRQLKDTF